MSSKTLAAAEQDEQQQEQQQQASDATKVMFSLESTGTAGSCSQGVAHCQ
jgi:hypothetical protein